MAPAAATCTVAVYVPGANKVPVIKTLKLPPTPPDGFVMVSQFPPEVDNTEAVQLNVPPPKLFTVTDCAAGAVSPACPEKVSEVALSEMDGVVPPPGLLIVNTTEFENNPPGLTTVTMAMPAETRYAAGTVAVSTALEAKPVASEIPFHCTMAP